MAQPGVFHATGWVEMARPPWVSRGGGKLPGCLAQVLGSCTATNCSCWFCQEGCMGSLLQPSCDCQPGRQFSCASGEGAASPRCLSPSFASEIKGKTCLLFIPPNRNYAGQGCQSCCLLQKSSRGPPDLSCLCWSPEVQAYGFDPWGGRVPQSSQA